MNNTVCGKETTEARNRRIAGNTIMLFLRILILTIVNLYAVRILLERLGAVDYGIFNAVAGVVTATSFINGTLDIAIQRFYSVAMGKGDMSRMSAVFSTSINIIAVISSVIFIIFEIAGLWFINTQMTIPAGRVYAANMSFHFAMISFILTIMQIPFTAAVFAYENMKAYTVISASDCLLRLAAAMSIGYIVVDNLILYNVGLMIVALLIFIIYVYHVRRNYAECRYRRVHDGKLAVQLLSFSGWTMLGPLARTGMVQGNTVLLNIFFGPVANVAFAIAMQINNAFGTLSNCLVLALRPPMIKAYAEGNNDYLNNLFSVSNKILFYLMLVVSVPAIMEMSTLLHLWLGNAVTDQIVLFSRLAVIFVMAIAMNNPITIIVHAVGKIRQYHLLVESITLLCVPITWFLFTKGYPAYYVLLVMTVVILAAHVIRIVCLKYIYPLFSIRQYVLSFCVPACVTVCVCFVSAVIIHSHLFSTVARMLLETCSTILFSALLVYAAGLTGKERALCNKLLKNVLNNKKIWEH